MGDGDRTRDIRCHRPTLYQLSYSHHRATTLVYANFLASKSGLRRSIQGTITLILAKMRQRGSGILIFGASGFAEHGTHHAEPGLPYYHLPAATNELAKDDPELVANHQYLGEFSVLTGAHPLQPPAGESK